MGKTFSPSVEEREAVARGATLLDAEKPGWEWQEGFDDDERLDIASGQNCTLGIVFEKEADSQSGYGGFLYYFLGAAVDDRPTGYDVGIKALKLGHTVLSRGRPYEYGFLSCQNQNISCRGLRRVWLEEVAHRRENQFSRLEALDPETVQEAPEKETSLV
jgi:hypothetical protein